MSALAGRRVVVTRPRAEADPLVRALEAAGAVPVLLPLLETLPPADPAPAEAALDRIAGFDWIVLTSGNAARFFAARWARRGRALPCPPRIAVIGPATAAAARGAGLTVHIESRDLRGRAIPAALGDLSGRAVLLPRSDLARAETPEAFAAAGARVDDVVFYRTSSAPFDADGVAAVRGGVDVLTFLSPSAVDAFVALLGDDARRVASRATVACIGPVTAEAARAAGFPVHVQPEISTGEALVRALEDAS